MLNESLKWIAKVQPWSNTQYPAVYDGKMFYSEYDIDSIKNTAPLLNSFKPKQQINKIYQFVEQHSSINFIQTICEKWTQ